MDARIVPSYPDARSLTLSVERFVEVLSTTDVMGVGGSFPSERFDTPPVITVDYDGQRATSTECQYRSESRCYQFGVHLPMELDAVRVTIRLECNGDSRIVFEQNLASIAVRQPPVPPRAGWLRTWLGRLHRAPFTLMRRLRHRQLSRQLPPRSTHDAFVANTAIGPAERQAMLAEQATWTHTPTISILLPVYNVEPRWLQKAVDSVRNQIYPHWQLCIADDASTSPWTLACLRTFVGIDRRITVIFRSENGHISAATNSAAFHATGEFLGLLDHDDALAPDALFEVARQLQTTPDADLIYSDEDKIDERDHRYDPQFKPDWSPELLLSYNYVNHFTVMRRSLFEAVGGFRVGFEGSQDHDLLLRLTERTSRVQHIPKILYHWRSLPASTAASAGVKQYVHESGRKAVAEALARRSIRGSLIAPEVATRLNLPILSLDGPDDGPLVTILLLGTENEIAESAQAIHQYTKYANYQITTVHDAQPLADRLPELPDGHILILLAGLRPDSPHWLSRLVAPMQIAGVGATGGLIRTPDGRIASAGIALGMKDGLGPDHAFAGLIRNDVSYYFLAEVSRNVSALDGRCLLTTKDRLMRTGIAGRIGQSTLWDVELGIHLRRSGDRLVYVAGCEFTTSHTDLTRHDDPVELRELIRREGRGADPFTNPNCDSRIAFRPSAESKATLTPSQPQRAIVATHNLNTREGAPRYLAEIVLGLHHRSIWTPTVLSPFAWHQPTDYDAAGLRTIVTDRPDRDRFNDGRWEAREYDRFLTFAVGLLKDQQPDLVVANTLLNFPLVEAAARAGIPSVWIVHESYTPSQIAALFTPFANQRIEACLRFATRCIFASHETAALYESHDQRANHRVIHNGIDPRPFDEYCSRITKADAIRSIGSKPDRLRFLNVGTVCERKGQHVLVEAAAELSRHHREFEVYLVGMRDHVPYARYIRELIRRRNLEGIVIPVTETDDAWSYFRAADVFAFPSRVEAFSRSIMEAMAFSLPILSTPVSGVGEQVEWAFNGLSFPFGDAAALAGLMRMMIDNPSRRLTMTRQSRAQFETHLSFDEMLDGYQQAILSAAREGPARSRILTQTPSSASTPYRKAA